MEERIMPNRILKETICTSENMDVLSAEAERFFYRLMVQCDDFGRMDARLPVLRARCYPLKLDTVNDAHIREWLNELIAADLIRLYTVSGRPYLYFVTWEKHQQIRAKKSKFPAPQSSEIASGDMQSFDINGYQLLSNVPENPIQSNTNTTRENVFVVFENEIGMLTPSISEEVLLAEKDYPAGWVEDALKAAAAANKRSWSYAKGILRNWQNGGRNATPPAQHESKAVTVVLSDGTELERKS
jgi:DnaD/phage-associated family protein